jgi:LPXTG-motif cell wall-anchored protein
MHAQHGMRFLFGAVITAGLAVVALSAAPAQAAEQSVVENPPVAGAGVCPENGGVIGQSFTLQQPGALSSYGFWLAAGDTPAGDTLTATVSVGWWIAGGFRPFVEQDVSFTVPEEPTLTTLTPVQPIPLLPNTMFAIAVDFHGSSACPVTFAPGADYAGGFMILGAQQAEGDLAFTFAFSPVDEEPGPYIPPGLSGEPPAGVAAVGEYFSYQFTVIGSNRPRIEVQDLVIPGLQLDANGLLSGTPTQAGTFQSTVRVTDGTITNARLVVLTVAAAPIGTPPPTADPPTTTPPAAPVQTVPATTTRTPASLNARKLPATGTETMPMVVLAAAALLAGGGLAAAGSVRRRMRDAQVR